ncbi:hypothetical protein [Streptomyces pseudovenezuelae]|uniref:hypothetical protein n=1 Tax=Streptomyces pseudovenezuelae TaxID=67350 RepID=UPI002E32E4F2|nr:hypothetical protein [Streptomyces pseudovenezuelae]
MGVQDPEGTAGAARQPRTRPGRKFGPLRDRSQEYNALARFLRTRVQEAGVTVSDLVTATGLQKSAISERLAGDKLDAEFVDAVIVACTEARELLPRRARLRAQGAELLRIARERANPVPDLTRHPPAVRNTAIAAMENAQRAQEELLDVYRDLTRKNDELEALTRVQQQSRLALGEATSLSSTLSTWVIILANEVEQLSLERELTITAEPPDLARLADVDAELATITARHGRTATALARTEQDRRLAAELLAEALTRTRRARAERQNLQVAAALPMTNGTSSHPPDGTAPAPLPPAPFGDDIDMALERAEAVSRRIADRLSQALTTLDPDAETSPLRESADNADNAVTSTESADNVLWWDLVADVPTPSFSWAERTAIALAQDRDPHDRRLTEIARDRPARDALLLADLLQERRWQEGAARLRIAVALALEPEALAPLILALVKRGRFMGRAQQGAQMLHVALLTRPPEDVVALHEVMAQVGDDLPRTVREGFGVAARRPYQDVLVMVRELIDGTARHAVDSVLFEAIVRNRRPAEVVALVDELREVDESIPFVLFMALPRPPVEHTELLVRLWNAVGPGPFREMLPGAYRGSSAQVADQIAELHQAWPPPLSEAAAALRDEIMKLIIRGTTLDMLEGIENRLERLGLSADTVFAPYAELFPRVPAPPAAP